MKGGYKIIDFKKVALSSIRVAIAGIMEDLTENNGKVVLLTNVVIGETEMDDCFSTVIVKSDQTIKLNCYDGYISINTNGVKYSSASVETLDEDVADLKDDFASIIHSKTIAATTSASYTITIPSASRHLLIISSGNSSLRSAMLLVNAITDGSISLVEVAKGSGTTISSTTNSVTITFSSAQSVTISDFALFGDFARI